jgi:hypothetical protein
MVPRRLPLVAAALSGVAIVATAGTLDASLSTPVVRPPPVDAGSAAGPSLLAALLRLLANLFGVRFGGAVGGAGRSALPALAAAAVVLTALAALSAVGLLFVRRGGAGRSERPARRERASAATTDPDWPPTPSGPVDRVWLALLARLDADRPHALTTGEWERRAVAAGHDVEGVARLRAAVDRTHYAADDPGDARAVARRSRERLGFGREAGDRRDSEPAPHDDGAGR